MWKTYLNLRTFTLIATTMSRTHHASQTTKVNTMLKAQTFSTRMEHESVWHHGKAVDPQVFSELSRNDVTVRKDNRFENFAVILGS